MTWTVEFAEDFEPEFDALAPPVQDELLAQAQVIQHFGPAAGRPRVDEQRFYARLIAKADRLFRAHLQRTATKRT